MGWDGGDWWWDESTDWAIKGSLEEKLPWCGQNLKFEAHNRSLSLTQSLTIAYSIAHYRYLSLIHSLTHFWSSISVAVARSSLVFCNAASAERSGVAGPAVELKFQPFPGIFLPAWFHMVLCKLLLAHCIGVAWHCIAVVHVAGACNLGGCVNVALSSLPM